MLTSSYFGYSQYKQKGSAHIFLIIILLLGIISGVYLVQKTQIFKPKAYSNDNQFSSQEIIKATADLNEFLLNQQGNIETAIQLASNRFEKLEKVAYEDPRLFLKLATLGSSKDKFPQEAQKYIEEDINIEGQIKVFHGDDFENKRPHYFYAIEDKYILHFASEPEIDLTQEQMVKLKGVALGMNLAVAPAADNFQVLTSSPGQVVDKSSPSDKATGSRKIGVVLIEFDKPQNGGYTKEDLNDYFFGQSNSIKDFYLKNSSGMLDFSGDVFGPYLVEGLNFHEICKSDLAAVSRFNLYPWLRAKSIIEEKLKKEENIDIFKEYDKVIFVSKQDYTCSTAGTAHLNLFATEGQFITIGLGTKSENLENRRRIFLAVAGHEIAHSLGIPGHANLLKCATRAIDYFNKCQKIDSGDPSDILSNTTFSSVFFNAPHKIFLGWVSQDQIQTIADPGIYKIKISALEEENILSDAKKVIRIRKKDPGALFWDLLRGGDLYYYISFRQKEGFYGNPSYYFTDGASIHLAFDRAVSRSRLDSYLISKGESLRDLVITDGEVFDDRLQKMKITQLSHDEDSATVEITFYDIQ